MQMNYLLYLQKALRIIFHYFLIKIKYYKIFKNIYNLFNFMSYFLRIPKLEENI